MKLLDTAWFEEAIEHHNGASQRDIMPLLGFYFCWAACSDLLGELHLDNPALDYDLLKERGITPLSVSDTIDSKLGEEDFNEEGKAFSAVYLKKRYFEDFTKTFIEETAETHPFAVSDTWENYERIAQRIEKRFRAWQGGKDINKPWWRFWG